MYTVTLDLDTWILTGEIHTGRATTDRWSNNNKLLITQKWMLQPNTISPKTHIPKGMSGRPTWENLLPFCLPPRPAPPPACSFP